MRQLVRRSIVQLELDEARALERGAEALLGDAVAMGHEPVVGLGEELAAVVRGLDVRDEERAAGLEEGREEACRVVDRGEVVEGRATLGFVDGGGEGRGEKEKRGTDERGKDIDIRGGRLTTTRSNLMPSSSPSSPLSSILTAFIVSGARPSVSAASVLYRSTETSLMSTPTSFFTCGASCSEIMPSNTVHDQSA